jgi:phage tail sheath protein FI
LDPFANNYIEKIIGNQIEVVTNDPSTGEYYVQLSGSYPNQSAYVRVKQVNQTTPNYFDNNGIPKNQFTGSLPITNSGSFGDGKGRNIPTGVAGAYYENISATNIQGLTSASYVESISLLANQDAYNYNFITAPGLIGNSAYHFPVVQQLITMVQNRGNAMAIVDVVGYNSNLIPVTTAASAFDTSYAATYWPWLKTIDPNSGQQVWVPASTMMPGVYAFNDNVAFPWFAPAGINRGLMTTVTQTERVLTQTNRDLLYQGNVNPIATFPGSGITVFGQKTLQKKKSALDRVNVRRLLIELKNYISQIGDTFVFEQNDAVTRNNFVAAVNPYLASVQQQQGLTAFRVVMDESNNPPSVVDQNQLVGQIYLQPTRTAEFIILDFNILPTGATFPA